MRKRDGKARNSAKLPKTVQTLNRLAIPIIGASAVEQSVFNEVVFERFKRQISSLLTNLLPGDEKSFTYGSFKARLTTENGAFLVKIEGPLNIEYGPSKKRDVVDYASAFFAVYTLGCIEAKNTDVGRLQYVC